MRWRVAGMIWPVPWRPAICAPRPKHRLVGAFDGHSIGRLEGRMHVRDVFTCPIHLEFIHEEVFLSPMKVVSSARYSKQREIKSVTALGIRHAQMHMIDQPAEMVFQATLQIAQPLRCTHPEK